MSKIHRVLVMTALVLGVTSCGASPLAPSAQAVSVSIQKSGGALAPGEAQSLSATVHYADGHSEKAASGNWITDNPQALTITGDGVILAVAAGSATVKFVLGTLTATQAVLVLPGVAGTWSGTYRITDCKITPIVVEADACETGGAPGVVWPFSLVLSQSGASVTGRTLVHGELVSAPFVTTMADDGSLTIAAEWIDSTLHLRLHQTWNISAKSDDRLEGTYREVAVNTRTSGNVAVTAALQSSIRSQR